LRIFLLIHFNNAKFRLIKQFLKRIHLKTRTTIHVIIISNHVISRNKPVRQYHGCWHS